MRRFEVLCGDSLSVLKTLPNESVQCCVTSPPYFGLRDYQSGDGEIGKEDSVEKYVQNLVNVFREVKRVLRKDGTCWLNLGDSYANSSTGGHGTTCGRDKSTLQSSLPPTKICPTKKKIPNGLKLKDLIGIPWRVAFALQADGWWLRSDIIWNKPNPMPESVTDRPTKSHEYLFLLTKSAKYFYDADAVREQSSTESSTRNKRTVWNINPQPFPGSHFAVFPEKLVEPCIKAGTSEHGCCSSCGTPYKRKVEKGKKLEEQMKSCGADSNGAYQGQSRKHKNLMVDGRKPHSFHIARIQNASDTKRRILEGMRERITTGWIPSCSCNAEIVPCLVLDPFCGSGTTGVVCMKHNRNFFGIDLKSEYCRMSEERIDKALGLLKFFD